MAIYNTYTPLATYVTPNNTDASISFTNLPEQIDTAYVRAFVLTVSERHTNDIDLNFRFNGDSGNNYTQSHARAYQGPSYASSVETYNAVRNKNSASDKSFEWFSYRMTIYNPSKPNKYFSGQANKTYQLQGMTETVFQTIEANFTVGHWTSSSKITSIQVEVDGGAFDTNSVFSLYALVGD